jgi:hypothetical protein
MNEGFSDIWGACIGFSCTNKIYMVSGEDIEELVMYHFVQ